VLNCQSHDVPILVASRLLKPLGNPAPNGIKFFASVDIFEVLKDRSWLAKMTNTINQHWYKKNARKTGRPVHVSQNGQSPMFDLPTKISD